MENVFDKVKIWYRDIPQKKQYVEFISALLSVPVLVTVILVNVNNLAQKNTPKASESKQPATAQNTPVITIIQQDKIIPATPVPSTFESVNSQSSAVCKSEVGPVDIISPKENEIINKDSICINVTYRKGEYCAIVWSYSLDNNPWSDYSDNTICLYNINNGEHRLFVRVKSVTSGEEALLKRTFIYDGQPSIYPTKAASSSASSTSSLP